MPAELCANVEASGTARVNAKAQEALNLEETTLTSFFNQMTARDQYEAASELTQLQTSLEASYTLTARLSNLSLLNYMR